MTVQKTRTAKAADMKRKWYVVDAEDQVLGRLATRVAAMLMGKGKPCFSRHVDCGDHVVVVNAGKVKVTGRKLAQKMYYHHTGYIGGIKSESLEKRLQEKPERVIEDAVYGMIPKNKLGRKMLSKLKVYSSSDHPHTAQKPEVLAP